MAPESLDTVEMMMAIEEAFEMDLGALPPNDFGGTAEIVDWLEMQLRRKAPNKIAIAFLKRIAETEHRPELVPHDGETWRREQIEAIVREIAKRWK